MSYCQCCFILLGSDALGRDIMMELINDIASTCVRIIILTYRMQCQLHNQLVPFSNLTWWRHQMDTFSMLLSLCAGNSLVTGEFSSQRPDTRSFVVFFDLHLNKRLSKQPKRRWFEMPSRPLWRHCNDKCLARRGSGHMDFHTGDRMIFYCDVLFLGGNSVTDKKDI